MKVFIYIISLSFFLSTTVVTAQTKVTGEWYGIGYVKRNGENNSYLCELILKQTGKKVTGTFNYYFRQDSFSTNLSGIYSDEKRWLQLNATPIVNFRAMDKNGAECPMEGDFTLMVSQLESTLTGQFNPTYEYRLLCPAITVKFVKYIPDTSKPVEIFDTIPAMPVIVKKDTLVKPVLPHKDTLRAVVKIDSSKIKPVIKDTTKPIIKTNVAPVKPPVKDTVKIAEVKKDTVKPVVTKRDTLISKTILKDTIQPSKPATDRKDSALRPQVVVIKRIINPNEKYIRELYRRTFELVAPIMEVEQDSVTVSFYDNGEIDNDTISVFYNRKPILLSQMLTDKPITIKLRLDTAVNEISMFAENLGRIPPNTAVAIINIGDQRYELSLSSSLQTNATIRFRKKAKVKDPKNIN